MLSDKLLINLKIIGKIQKNGRISKSCSGIVSIETDSYFQCLWRSITSNSRKQTLIEINNILFELESTLYTIYNSKFMNKEYSKSEEFYKMFEEFKLLLTEIEGSEQGIFNLKFTYISDVNISAQLDVVILRIKALIKEAHQKLKLFESF